MELWEREWAGPIDTKMGKDANQESSPKLLGTTVEGFIYSGRDAEEVMLVYGKAY